MEVVAGCVIVLFFCSLSDAGGKFEMCMERDYSTSYCFCQSGINRPFNGIVTCDHVVAHIGPLMCVTNSNGTIRAGECPFTGQNLKKRRLVQNISNLTQDICGAANRGGKLCGNCQEGTGLAINTFGLECIPGSRCHSYMWVVYFIVEYTVLTLFCLIVIIFNIRANSDSANAFILFAQIITLPINVLTIQRDWDAVLGNNNKAGSYLAWIIEIIYGIWSLNVPSGIIYRMCPSENTTSLEAFAVRYPTAAFPLSLIFIVYIFIKLYERNCKLVTLVWALFRNCCIRFRRRIDPKITIIDAFATFISLSYTKFVHISLILLAPTPSYDINGTRTLVLLYDGNIDYFKDQHRYYGALAIIVLLFFVIPLPVLLFFYNKRWFQIMLHCCHLNSHTLNLFVNAFQSDYKDGSEGTKDYRFFSGIYFTFRILIFGLYAFVVNYFILYYCLNILILIWLALVITFRPYKREIFNKLDPIMYLFFAFVISTAIHNNILIIYANKPSLAFQIIFYFLFFIPAIYMGVYTSIWLLKKIHDLYIKNVHIPVNEEGRANTPIGRVIQTVQSLQRNSQLDDIEGLLNRERSDSEIELSAEYLEYYDTPTGTNTTTTEHTTTNTNTTDNRSTDRTTNNTLINRSQGLQAFSTQDPQNLQNIVDITRSPNTS